MKFLIFVILFFIALGLLTVFASLEYSAMTNSGYLQSFWDRLDEYADKREEYYREKVRRKNNERQ